MISNIKEEIWPKHMFFLYCVENSLRIFIDKLFREELGSDYFERINCNRDIKSKIDGRVIKEEKNQWLPVRGKIQVFYSDFSHLNNLIKSNWQYFEKYFPDQQWISQRIKELSDIRILVAHNSLIHKEQKDLIRIYYRQIITQIQQRMNED